MISAFSSSRESHVAVLHSIAKHRSDLDLTLKPSKCASFVYDGRKVPGNISFPIGDGSTRNICTGPIKFLGLTLFHSLPATAKESGKRFVNFFLEKPLKLDSFPIRGKYQLWILCRFLIPSFHFILSIDVIPQSSINKAQSQCTRKIKHWLGLPRGVTNAVIYHPNVIDIPTITEYRTMSKLSFLSSIHTCKNPLITDLRVSIVLDAIFPVETNELTC